MSAEQRFLDLFAAGFERATRGDLRGANELYERALRTLEDQEHPQLTAILTNLAQNALALGELDLGWQYFDRALTRALAADSPGQRLAANTWHQLAWILYERGEVGHATQALELIDRALAGDNRLETHDTKLRILLKLGRDPEARKIAVEALHRDFTHRDFQDVKLRWGLITRQAVAAARSGRPTPPDDMPRPKPVAELREWKGRRLASPKVRRTVKKAPLLELTPTRSERSPRALRARAIEELRRYLRSARLLEGARPPRRLDELAVIAADPAGGAYLQVDAALGLALLGDTPQLARIRLCPRLNQNAITVELAVEILEALAYGSG